MANYNRNQRNSRSANNWNDDIQGINDQYGRESASNRNNTNYGLSSNRSNRNTQGNYNTQGTSYNDSGNFDANAGNYNRGRYQDYGSGYGQQNRESRNYERTDNYSDMGRGSYRNTGYGSNQSNYGSNMNTGYGTSGMGYGANSGYGNRNERAGNTNSADQRRSNASQRSNFGGRSESGGDRSYGTQRSGFGGRSNTNYDNDRSGRGYQHNSHNSGDWGYDDETLNEDRNSDYGRRSNSSFGSSSYGQGRSNNSFREDLGDYSHRGDNYYQHNYDDAYDDYDQRDLGTQGSYRGVTYHGDENLGDYGYEGRQSRASNRRGQENERGTWDRTRDELSSWFGNEDARRRRDNDRLREERDNDMW